MGHMPRSLSKKPITVQRCANISHPRLAEVPNQNRQGQLPAMEVCEYAGAYGYKNQGDGQDFVRLRMQEIEAAAKHFEASGGGHLQPGRSFILAGHLGPKDLGSKEGDNKFLITEVKLELE